VLIDTPVWRAISLILSFPPISHLPACCEKIFTNNYPQ